MKRKKVEESYCNFRVYGCDVPGHKTAVAKSCKFHSIYMNIQKTKMSSQKKSKQLQFEIEKVSQCDNETKCDGDVAESM